MGSGVQHRLVDAGADVVAEWSAPEAGRHVVHVAGSCSGLADHLLGPTVDVEQVRAWLAALLQGPQDVRHQGAGAGGLKHPCRRQDLDHGSLVLIEVVRTGIL